MTTSGCGTSAETCSGDIRSTSCWKKSFIAPCSIKTLSAVANSYSNDLMSRAADVCLKEGRPLLLMVRETPLHKGHLKLMLAAADAGAIIFPPAPAFYGRPQTVDDLINATVGRALARLGIENSDYFQWTGMGRE